jgi:hypothetical protein
MMKNMKNPTPLSGIRVGRRYIHTYHSRFIPEGIVEASQIFLQDAHVLPKSFSYE